MATAKTNFTVLVMYKMTSDWLILSREERSAFVEKHLNPLIAKYSKKIEVSFYDSEAFHARTSDFMMVNCDDLNDYYFFMEAMRDTKLFSVPYLVLTDILIGIPDGFKKYEALEV